MFGLYFSRYLIENNLVDKADTADMAALQCQAFINRLIEKKCFDSNAAEKHLSEFKKEYGLTAAGIEAISSGNMEQIVPVFIHFDAAEAIARDIAAFQKDNNLTDAEIETLKKNKGIGWFSPSFVLTDPMVYNSFVHTAIENIVSSASCTTILKPAYQTQKYAFRHLACQELKGTHRIFLGIAGDEENLLAVAGLFAGKKFSGMDKITREVICEFINRVNGSYASRFSVGDVFMKLGVPYWHSDKELVSNGDIYCLPVVVGDAPIELVFSFDNEVDVAA